MNSTIQTVNRYKAKSADPIRDQQVAYIPRLQDDQVDYITSYYIIGGKRIPVNITNQIFIKLKYLKFRSISIRRFLKYRSGEFSMQELVDDKIIIPFMLFINGWFVPWEYMTIAIDGDNYHIAVDGSNNGQVALMCRNCDFVQIVTLPEYATCVTECENPLNAMFVFNDSGKYDIDDPKYYIVSSTGYHGMGFNYWHTEQNVDAFKLLNQTDIKLTDANIMLFVNGLFASGVRNKTPRGIDGDYKKDNGYVAPCVDFTYSPNYVYPNPEVRLDSVLLTINNGSNENGDVYDFGLFVNPNYTETIDNISKVDADQLAPIISEHNLTGTTPDYLANLRIPFEMKMNRQKYYAENLADCLKTISQYDASLFNSIFSETSNLVIEEHNYEWIQAHIKGGAIILPISYGDNTSEYVVVLVNGRLYEYSHMIRYYTSKVIIPIQNIGPDDTIEFLRFKNINNLEKKVIINANDGYINYSEDYINKNIAFFTTDYNGTVYEFPSDGKQHFEVEYTLLKNANGYTKVVLNDPYYYGKELIMTYKNRFKWEVFTIGSANEGDLLTDTSIAFTNSSSTVNLGTALVVGNKYVVYWNDVKYEVECTAADGSGSVSIGNAALIDGDTTSSEYPFCLSGVEGSTGVFAFKNTETIETVTLKIYEYKDSSSEYVFNLGDRFMYCNQYNRYLVFLNNTRLSTDHYRLVLPVRPTTPFSEFKIYLTMPVSEGDRLDIIYTPALFQDIILRDTIATSGDVAINKSVLDYGLSTDLYMIWINGKKIAQSNISDIDTTHIRVTSDEQSTHDLCITKFIPSIEEIDKAFDENSALWDTITATMTADEINKLLGIKTNSITDMEANRYENAASIKTIMNQIIRDEFISNPSIDISGPFVYDYLDVDTTIVSGYDSGSNAMLETTDANHYNNFATEDTETNEFTIIFEDPMGLGDYTGNLTCDVSFTWREFCESAYNLHGYYCFDDKVYSPSGYLIYGVNKSGTTTYHISKPTMQISAYKYYMYDFDDV